MRARTRNAYICMYICTHVLHVLNTHTYTHTHTHADYVAYVCASCVSQSLLSVCPPRHPDLSRLLLDVSFRLHVCRFVCMCKIIPDCGSIEHGDDCSKRKMMMMLERIFEQLFSYKYIYIYIYITFSRVIIYVIKSNIFK